MRLLAAVMHTFIGFTDAFRAFSAASTCSVVEKFSAATWQWKVNQTSASSCGKKLPIRGYLQKTSDRVRLIGGLIKLSAWSHENEICDSACINIPAWSVLKLWQARKNHRDLFFMKKGPGIEIESIVRLRGWTLEGGRFYDSKDFDFQANVCSHSIHQCNRQNNCPQLFSLHQNEPESTRRSTPFCLSAISCIQFRLF